METTNDNMTVKQQLIRLLGRKVIMLALSIAAGGVLYYFWEVDPFYIVGLYAAFVGGNSVERLTNRNNNNRGD